jgi:hypothetical protein
MIKITAHSGVMRRKHNTFESALYYHATRLSPGTLTAWPNDYKNVLRHPQMTGVLID